VTEDVQNRSNIAGSKVSGAFITLIVALANLGGCPTEFVTDTLGPGARVVTSLGEFTVALDVDAEPNAVVAFGNLVDSGFYSGASFGRALAGTLVQAGAFSLTLSQKQTRPPIVNEAAATAANARTTVAMARTDDPDSARSQFFVNLADNASLDASDTNPGFAVFGRVVEGMDVIDQIGALDTGQRDGLSDVPLDNIVILRAERVDVGPSANPRVRLVTSLGEFVIELTPATTPVTVGNFLQYVDEGFYVGTVFHRVVPGFVVQGGGFELARTALQPDSPIPPGNTLLSTLNRGQFASIAPDPTAPGGEWLVALGDGRPVPAGAAVTSLGRVVEGLDVLDAISNVPTATQDGAENVPIENVSIQSIAFELVPTGGMELSAEARAFLEQKGFVIETTVRNLLVNVLTFALSSGLQGGR